METLSVFRPSGSGVCRSRDWIEEEEYNRVPKRMRLHTDDDALHQDHVIFPPRAAAAPASRKRGRPDEDINEEEEDEEAPRACKKLESRRAYMLNRFAATILRAQEKMTEIKESSWMKR